MRRILILTFSAALLIWLVPSEVSAGGANGFNGRYGQGCCAAGPLLYTYPSNLPAYVMSGPYYFNPNLYYYRNYYPYPMPNRLRTSPRWRGRGIILEQ